MDDLYFYGLEYVGLVCVNCGQSFPHYRQVAAQWPIRPEHIGMLMRPKPPLYCDVCITVLNQITENHLYGHKPPLSPMQEDRQD